MCWFLQPNDWDLSSANNDKSPGWIVVIMDCHLQKCWREGKKESCEKDLTISDLHEPSVPLLTAACLSASVQRQMFQIRWETRRKGRAKPDATEDNTPDVERAMIVTILIYVEMLPLPKLCSTLSFTLHRHHRHPVFTVASTAHHTAHFYLRNSGQGRLHSFLHYIHL